MNASAAPQPWHQLEAQHIADPHGVDLGQGLAHAEASQRAEQHGPNELQAKARPGPWALLAEQFKDFMVLLLLGAAAISGLIGDLTDTLVILFIVLLNADLGVAALQQLAAAQATVLREGQPHQVPASSLVPGDAAKTGVKSLIVS